jgi:hypothetical protein
MHCAILSTWSKPPMQAWGVGLFAIRYGSYWYQDCTNLTVQLSSLSAALVTVAMP